MSQYPFALYNPALLPPDILLAEFTARRPLLERLLDIVRGNAPGHPPQHCLLIGARGMGKTTTLWAIAHRVARDPGLAAQWQAVVFDEESRRVGDLTDFWLEALRQWEYATQNSAGMAGRLLDEPVADIEERARRSFLEAVERSGKRALLLIDNLNHLLGSIQDPEPLHRLRAFLMKDHRVMIIGAAAQYFDEITSVDQPFYEFFRCFDLQPLTLDEMQECLRTLAETRGDESIKRVLEERGGTVQALHVLTGGNPRLVKTFYRLLQEGLHGDIRADLEKLLDEFTPYFKAIVDALSGQQQRILDAVALAWDPVEVATIARMTRLPSNQVSAQLRALVKSGLVREAPGHPKRKTYLLADRFSNIHYLMRHGRAARNRFDWFVALVRLVFPDKKAVEILQANHLGRPAEAEAAYRKAIGLDPKDACSWSGLADLLSKKSETAAEARTCAITALRLEPNDSFARAVFLRLCGKHSEDWRSILPAMAAWCVAHPKAEDVFKFAVEGFLRLVRLTQTSESLAILDALSDITPFETVRDVFRAYTDRDHLNRLAPERQNIAVELLKRISEPEPSTSISPKKKKTK